MNLEIHISIEPRLPGSSGGRPNGGAEAILIRVCGELDTSTSGQLEASLAELLAQGVRLILLEFTEMDYVSSVGLRVLLVTLKKLRADGGRMILTGLNPEVQEVFDMAGFSSLFEIAPSLEHARVLLRE